MGVGGGGWGAQQRIRLGDPVILSRTGTRDLDQDPGTGDREPGLFSAVVGWGVVAEISCVGDPRGIAWRPIR